MVVAGLDVVKRPLLTLLLILEKLDAVEEVDEDEDVDLEDDDEEEDACNEPPFTFVL